MDQVSVWREKVDMVARRRKETKTKWNCDIIAASSPFSTTVAQRIWCCIDDAGVTVGHASDSLSMAQSKPTLKPKEHLYGGV